MEESGVLLVKPAIEWREPYIAFYREWKDSGERMVPWVIGKDPSDFPAMLRFLSDNANGINLREGWVPDSTYWLVNQDGSKVLGAVNIRHGLTGYLFDRGGHIGYGIRPSERQKGYAKKLLALSLGIAKELDIRKALVTCDDTNAASAKTIERNGGVRDTDYIEENGNVVRRYWIDT
ncbi:GNAT family N-acetyltransferase [Paenibacillus thermotolerans]|uniref:GNAT family N-acetyltransferase n=1 Tax=Paenibacillus thermotolerans TaxID=3027807 RepID=UPI002368A69D|nr:MULTISPECIES: GNAT family N-acetyltransferase [unclassified Paenibacillus]